MIDWQPIEKAPKEGSLVLLWEGGYLMGFYDLGDWLLSWNTDHKLYPSQWAPLNPPMPSAPQFLATENGEFNGNEPDHTPPREGALDRVRNVLEGMSILVSDDVIEDIISAALPPSPAPSEVELEEAYERGWHAGAMCALPPSPPPEPVTSTSYKLGGPWDPTLPPSPAKEEDAMTTMPDDLRHASDGLLLRLLDRHKVHMAEGVMHPTASKPSEVDPMVYEAAMLMKHAADRIAELEWQLYGNAGRGKPRFHSPADEELFEDGA